jgi:hypothetical protein
MLVNRLAFLRRSRIVEWAIVTASFTVVASIVLFGGS